MSSRNAEFEINISDDGKGFDLPATRQKAESAATPSGDGLSNMCQRLADMGGHCTIVSAPGQGTNIRFVIPLNNPTKDV